MVQSGYFYPASGLRYQTSGAFGVTGSAGIVWSSAVSGTIVYHFRFIPADVTPSYALARAHGFPVRCVQNLHQTI